MSTVTSPRARTRTVTMLGPAFVAAVAYVDPGNFATNITAGAQFGYALVWVVVAANFVAMLVQYLSAKLGIATGSDLSEQCRERYPRPVTLGLWVQAELVAMATDLAEFVGAALGLYLLFGVPLPAAGLITAVVSFGLLELTRRGYRPFELAIAGLLGIVFMGFAYSLVQAGSAPDAQALVPLDTGNDMLVLAVGIIGATVMPHVIYLHSALTKVRKLPATKQVLKAQRVDVMVALGTAGLINVAMLVLAAAVLPGLGDADPIMFAHEELGRMLGGGAALAFAVALLASGLSSSSVGTYAGQVVMSGFIRRSIPLVVRRGVTMLPALVVLSLGLPVTESLVISQVVLSFGIPFALIPLVLLTRRQDVMGRYVNRKSTTIVAGLCALVVTALNLYLATSAILG
ncbi:manganese transport protein [Kibdelosporangium banguiense]|uniref:Manganese transport protein n=1 Tax=Kibdelosporangium banguiense TaxID=1365924 RepID=A0ABS4TM95_9PSEU|nr:Nramp family divalent metal transporter [Kibdelosporangium banguiense]MBP2325119.1 manganese transport protein [Kibdelosporangium banguiense]